MMHKWLTSTTPSTYSFLFALLPTVAAAHKLERYRPHLHFPFPQSRSFGLDAFYHLAEPFGEALSTALLSPWGVGFNAAKKIPMCIVPVTYPIHRRIQSLKGAFGQLIEEIHSDQRCWKKENWRWAIERSNWHLVERMVNLIYMFIKWPIGSRTRSLSTEFFPRGNYYLMQFQTSLCLCDRLRRSWGTLE